MKPPLFISLGFLLFLSLTLQSCSKAPSTPIVIIPLPTNTQALPTLVAATPVPTAAEPTSTFTLEPTKIQHITRPEEPSYLPAQTTIDCTIGRTYVSNQPVVIPPACDNFDIGFVERPVATDTKDYLPYLDIGEVDMGGNSNWIFARIITYNDQKPIGTGNVFYFLKLDLNFDGRNSNVILVGVKNLPADALNWTVDGVQAWHDNEGVTSLVFDQGIGSDSDLVWARRSPKAIEVAFKPTLLNGTMRFAWWAWTYQGNLTPPDISLSVSIPNIYQMDNTCAWGFNVSASALPNVCSRE